jgi:tetratricopeptide (TPR) repeat protein
VGGRGGGLDTDDSLRHESAESLWECGHRALEYDGDLASARRWFGAAYVEAERTGDVAVMARAVVGYGGLWVHEHRTAVAAGLFEARAAYVGTLVAAAGLDPEKHGDLALRLRVRAAGESDYREGRSETILALLDEARASPDPAARIEALSIAHHCLLGPEYEHLRRRLADELIGEAARSGRRGPMLMSLLWQVVDLLLSGDRHAGRRLAELRAQLAEGPHLAADFVAGAVDVMLAIRAGRLEEAEQLAQQCYELGTKAGDADAQAWYAAQLVAIRWYQGRLPELLPMLYATASAPTLSAVDNSLVGAVAVASAMAGDRRAAENALASLRGSGLDRLPRSSSWLVTMYGIVEAAYLLDNRHAAARVYGLLLPFAHLPMMASLGVACFGSVEHALGVAALTTGDLDRAIEHLREAVHRNLALGHWPAVRTSRQRFAEALDRRGGPDDAAAAAAQRTAAGELAPPGESGADAHAVTCVRQGRRWRVGMGARSVTVDHMVGMLHLAVLTANAGAEIRSIELVAGVESLGRAAAADAGSAQALLDETAVRRYRQRVAELTEAIDVAGHRGVAAAVATMEQERDWVLAQLGTGTGLAGRRRSFANDEERARLAVGRAIRRAVAQIDRADPVIGAHLRASVHSGMRCWYQPTGPVA